MLVLLLTAALFALVLIGIYLKAFYSPLPGQNKTFSFPGSDQFAPYRDTIRTLVHDLAQLPFEPVAIVSHDGLKLYGRYYHSADGAPLDISFHGYRGTAERDMSGAMRISRMLGHNVLMVDQRAHGKSRGHTITFGIRERRDCLSWVQYARQRFGSDVRIMLYGVSMGGATVLMAADQDFGGNVRGIIADCPYDSPEAIIRKVCRDMRLPERLAWPLIVLAARMLGRFDIREISASEAVCRSSLPILILHGEDDSFVPCEMSECIAKFGSISRHTFPGAAHGMSYLKDTERYNALVMDFMRRCLQ